MIIGKHQFPSIVPDNNTLNTTSMRFKHSTGEVAILLENSAGSITVKQECSWDDRIWYVPVDQDGNALGDVVTAHTATADTYIVFSPVITKFIRFSVLENNSAATTVTIHLIFQEFSLGGH